jgi:3-oxosteroid 1-dehydrogenase
VAAEGLAGTVRRFNGFAKTGQDRDFQRGELGWRLAKRDVPKGSNASLGTIAQPPFYGLQLSPSSLPSAGLLVNTAAQVLDQRRMPIAGLYAIGNAAAHTEYGAGFQAGYSLASGLTFDYLAIEDIRQRSLVRAAT